MNIDEDEIRRRAHRIWEAEGRPAGKHDEHWQRAHAEIEREFRRATEYVGEEEHRRKLPLQVEEALDPNHWRHDSGGTRGAS